MRIFIFIAYEYIYIIFEGIIGKTYFEGQEINVTIDITANHAGFFEFRLCQNDESMKKVEQECFDKHLLLVADNNDKDAPKNLNPELNSKPTCFSLSAAFFNFMAIFLILFFHRIQIFYAK